MRVERFEMAPHRHVHAEPRVDEVQEALVEIVKAAREETDIKAVESSIQRTITEALMVNPETEYVRNFRFSWDGAGSLQVVFVVKGHEWDEDTLSVTY